MVDQLTQSVIRWAAAREDIAGVLLVGSHARGTATVGADVDLIVLADDPGMYTSNTTWVETFGSIEGFSVESWGAVTSLRVRYSDGPEVEFGVTSPAWARVDPVDAGTRDVVEEGLRILYDPQRMLERLSDAVTRS